MSTNDSKAGVQVIYGINPLLESLKFPGQDIQTLFLLREKKGELVRQLLLLAAGKKIPVVYKTREEMDRLSGNGVHQGVMGIRRAFSPVPIEEIVLRPREENKRLLVLLDGITDPQNMGAIIRTGHCFGVDGFIVPENRSSALTASVFKASAGALSHMPVAVVVNLARAIDFLKEQNFWIYGADMGGTSSCRVFDHADRVALVMGSEGKGLRPLIRKKCDFLVSVAMRNPFDSLNVSVAAGIIMYDIVRNWRKEQNGGNDTGPCRDEGT